MTEALAKDKKLKMNFTQYYNPKKTADAYKTPKLKTEFYKADPEQDDPQRTRRKGHPGHRRQGQRPYAAYADAHAKELDRKTLEKEILEMAEARNQELLKTLQQQPGVTKKNVTVTTAPRSALTPKKAMYKVQIDVQ